MRHPCRSPHRRHRSRSWLIALLPPLLLLGVPPARAEAPEPFERTEERPRCDHYTPTRQPFFGQTHVHTQYSADAAQIGTRNTPRDAYRFARGEAIGLAPYYDTSLIRADESQPSEGGVSAHPSCMPPERCQFTAARTIQLPADRALDFMAVTDHSEFLGATNICLFEGAACEGDSDCDQDAGQSCSATGSCTLPGYNSPTCIFARQTTTSIAGGLGTTIFGVPVLRQRPQQPIFPFCGLAGDEEESDCTFQTENVWQQIIAAAEEAYDRTSACEFTSFIGYEYTAMPLMGQCVAGSEPCFADADCGDGDSCGNPGQCTDPPGKACSIVGRGESGDCAEGATCILNGGGNNLHRNVIFRNANVPELPVAYTDVPTGCGAGPLCQAYTGPWGDFPRGAFSSLRRPSRGRNGGDSGGRHVGGVALGSPAVMLRELVKKCNPELEKPCEFLSIPHNPNVSGGAMFMLPETPEDARVRAEHERLVEIFQIKGGSECRYSAAHPNAWQPGAYAPDELCDFENMSFATLGANYLNDPDGRSIPASSYVRNALKAGLAYQREHPKENVNPFRLGFVGSLDTHNGAPTASEADYAKAGAHGLVSYGPDGQMLNETFFLGLETNGGGMGVVWAEENSRDSIFAAMQRRETYATSGTRPIVRFFGGSALPETICRSGDFAQKGYADGVPMGGTLDPSSRRPPRFAVSALMDPGAPGHPGATLQRAQIVKGWVDDSGEVHERVYDVAGGSDVAPVDLETCVPAPLAPRAASEAAGRSNRHARLCAVWTDPDFDPGLHAFYYARILENPSCRWNQYYCLDRGVDCGQPPHTGAAVVGYEAYEFQQCCSDEVPRTVQQRAWTSPIWYEPPRRRGDG